MYLPLSFAAFHNQDVTFYVILFPVSARLSSCISLPVLLSANCWSLLRFTPTTRSTLVSGYGNLSNGGLRFDYPSHNAPFSIAVSDEATRWTLCATEGSWLVVFCQSSEACTNLYLVERFGSGYLVRWPSSADSGADSKCLLHVCTYVLYPQRTM